MAPTDEVDSGKGTTSQQSPPGSAGYSRQTSVRYTKEPSADAAAADAWPKNRPPSVPTAAAAVKSAVPGKAADGQPLKTDKDGYLETSIGASGDDRCSGYLDAVEPAGDAKT